MSDSSNRGENPWLDALGVEIPPLDELAARKGLTLRELVTAALLHAGRPLDLEELAGVLEAAGVRAKSGNMPLSIPRAWGGREPIWRDETGKFGVDLQSREIEFFLVRIDVQTGPRLPLPLRPEPPDVPPEDVPLDAYEFDAAVRKGNGDRLSLSALFAALLESSGRSIPLRESEDILRLMGVRLRRNLPKAFRKMQTAPVSIDDDGVLHLEAAHQRMLTIRRQVRAFARDAIYAQSLADHARAVDRVRREARDQRRKRSQATALTTRRAVIRALPEKAPHLFGRLDAATRELRTWPVSATDEIAADLTGYDVLVGLAPRTALERAGQAAEGFAVRDLSPPQKTLTINRRGRTLRITPKLLIVSSVRISRPLADPRVVAKYVREGHEGRLRRRLESDLKALFAFYRYGILHRAARLRWGFLDEFLPVGWAEEGDASLRDLVRSVVEDGRSLEVVTGHAPSFTAPWARARSVTVIPPRRWDPAILIDDRTGEEIRTAEVQTARLR